jgi:hypothetical protein
VKPFYPVESSGTGPNPFNKETPWPAREERKPLCFFAL